MTVAEYKQGIQILLNSWLTDPTSFDKLSEEYRERMHSLYEMFWMNRNGERFIEACKVLADNMTTNKMPTNGQIHEQYKQMVVEEHHEKVDRGDVVGMTQDMKDLIEKINREKKMELDDDVPF